LGFLSVGGALGGEESSLIFSFSALGSLDFSATLVFTALLDAAVALFSAVFFAGFLVRRVVHFFGLVAALLSSSGVTFPALAKAAFDLESTSAISVCVFLEALLRE
jgi:hypothetical protein